MKKSYFIWLICAIEVAVFGRGTSQCAEVLVLLSCDGKEQSCCPPNGSCEVCLFLLSNFTDMVTPTYRINEAALYGRLSAATGDKQATVTSSSMGFFGTFTANDNVFNDGTCEVQAQIRSSTFPGMCSNKHPIYQYINTTTSIESAKLERNVHTGTQELKIVMKVQTPLADNGCWTYHAHVIDNMEVEVTTLCCPRNANDSLIFDDTALDNLPPALCVIISAAWGTSLQINSTCEKILLEANTNPMRYVWIVAVVIIICVLKPLLGCIVFHCRKVIKTTRRNEVLVLPNRERAMSALPVSVVCEDAQANQGGDNLDGSAAGVVSNEDTQDAEEENESNIEMLPPESDVLTRRQLPHKQAHRSAARFEALKVVKKQDTSVEQSLNVDVDYHPEKVPKVVAERTHTEQAVGMHTGCALDDYVG